MINVSCHYDQINDNNLALHNFVLIWCYHEQVRKFGALALVEITFCKNVITFYKKHDSTCQKKNRKSPFLIFFFMPRLICVCLLMRNVNYGASDIIFWRCRLQSKEGQVHFSTNLGIIAITTHYLQIYSMEDANLHENPLC